MALALADTSVFIGIEAGRIPPSALDEFDLAVSVITLGELRLGVMMARAREAPELDRRLATYDLARLLEPIPVDDAVANTWAVLISRLRAAGRKIPVNDSWIAATALTAGVPVLTQDTDYDSIPDLRTHQI